MIYVISSSMIIPRHRVPSPQRYKHMERNLVSDSNGLTDLMSSKLGLWIMAAKFEFEVMVSPSSARSLFQRALRLMPQDKKLWVEVIEDRENLIGGMSVFCSILNLNYCTWKWYRNDKRYWIVRNRKHRRMKKMRFYKAKLFKLFLIMLNQRSKVRE